MLLWIHDTRCEAKLINAKFLMLGDDLSVWDVLSSMTFPWLLMIFQSPMTFHDFPRTFYFPRFSRPCGNPVNDFFSHCILWMFSVIWDFTTMCRCQYGTLPSCFLLIIFYYNGLHHHVSYWYFLLYETSPSCVLMFSIIWDFSIIWLIVVFSVKWGFTIMWLIDFFCYRWLHNHVSYWCFLSWCFFHWCCGSLSCVLLILQMATHLIPWRTQP